MSNFENMKKKKNFLKFNTRILPYTHFHFKISSLKHSVTQFKKDHANMQQKKYIKNHNFI